MVSEAAEAGGLEPGLAGFADGGTTSGVFVVGGDVADSGVEAHGVVSGSDDRQVGSQHGGVDDGFEVRAFGFEVARSQEQYIQHHPAGVQTRTVARARP
jgi:hypothetical protein